MCQPPTHPPLCCFAPGDTSVSDIFETLSQFNVPTGGAFNLLGAIRTGPWDCAEFRKKSETLAIICAAYPQAVKSTNVRDRSQLPLVQSWTGASIFVNFC